MASACIIARRLRQRKNEDENWVRRASAWVTENVPCGDAVASLIPRMSYFVGGFLKLIVYEP